MLIELINFKIINDISIEYNFLKNGEKANLIIQTSDENIDYTNYDIALEIVKKKVLSLNFEKQENTKKLKLKKNIIKKREEDLDFYLREKKQKITITKIEIEELSNKIKEKKIRKIKIINDEDLNFIVRDKIWKIKKTTDFYFIKESIDEFANKLYKARDKLDEKDFGKLRDIYFFWFSNSKKKYKGIETINYENKSVIEFLKNSESIILIRMILNIF